MKNFLRVAAGTTAALLLVVLLLELRLRTVSGPAVPEAAGLVPGEVRILALGDSITHGGLKENSYPFALKKILEKEQVKAQVFNLGITGMETRDLDEKVAELLRQYQPHVVVTMVGAGDRNTGEGLRQMFRSLRVFRLLDVTWKSWRTELVRRLYGKDDPIARAASEYYASGRDDVDYIRRVHDPLLVTDRIKLAEQTHRKILLKFPQHEHARVALGLVRAKMGQSEEAEELYRSVIRDFEAKPDHRNSIHWAYFSLASLLAELDRDQELESHLKALITKYPWNELAYEHLSVLYRRQKKGMELQRLLESGIKESRSPDRLRLMLARYFRETGHEKEALAQEAVVRSLHQKSLLGDTTLPAYRSLSSKILGSGAAHVVMQYPMLDVGLLGQVLGPESRDLRYVSNESFREAVANRHYDFYFLDDFGGLYGHLTEEGAKLMGTNVAAVLLPLLRDRGLAKGP
jgi:tetratricopeptide (TPR) repeat protein